MQYNDYEKLLTDEEYGEALQILRGFTHVAVLSMREKCPDDFRHMIIGNFIIRGMNCLDSIFLLWENEQYQDGWSLHRTLADRFFHLYDLIETDGFEEFERWSFQRQYRDAEKYLNDPDIRGKIPPLILEAAMDQQRRRKERHDREPVSKWRRPKAEEVAKRAKLPFIYPASYDTPSALVHPMAEDGQAEFKKLMGEISDYYEPTFLIIHNSLILQYFLLWKGLRACSAVWGEFISDFFEHWLSYMETGLEKHYIKAVLSLSYDPSQVSWCEYSAPESVG